MLVAVAVVPHRGPVDGSLERRRVNVRRALCLEAQRGGLQVGERAPPIAAGQPDQVVKRVGVERDGAGQATFVGEGALHQHADVVVIQRLQREQQGA